MILLLFASEFLVFWSDSHRECLLDRCRLLERGFWHNFNSIEGAFIGNGRLLGIIYGIEHLHLK